MKKWFKFLLIPLILIWVMEFIQAIVLGGLFFYAPDDFWSLVVTFFIFSGGGYAMHAYSPSKNKIVLSSIFSTFYLMTSISLGLYNSGQETVLLGEKVTNEFFALAEVIKALGLYSMVYGGYLEDQKKP